MAVLGRKLERLDRGTQEFAPAEGVDVSQIELMEPKEHFGVAAWSKSIATIGFAAAGIGMGIGAIAAAAHGEMGTAGKLAQLMLSPEIAAGTLASQGWLDAAWVSLHDFFVQRQQHHKTE